MGSKCFYQSSWCVGLLPMVIGFAGLAVNETEGRESSVTGYQTNMEERNKERKHVLCNANWILFNNQRT